MKDCYTAETSERGTQVSNEVHRLTDIVAEIDRQVAELKDKLDDIIIAEPPQVAAPKNEPMEENLVPLAERIRELRRRLERVDSNMNNLMRRIEL